jgi:putative transposase
MRSRVLEKESKVLSLRRQCDLLGVSRGKLYYAPKVEKEENLQYMRIMDAHLLHHPTEGVKSMVHLLTGMGYEVGPKRIRRLFRIMGWETLYRRKNLTKMGYKEYIRPYLLRGLEINRVNQVWSTDITYIPMSKGFLYLTAVMDVYSRKILTWGISNTLDGAWCRGVLQEALDRYGIPEIINTDQGSQYTNPDWHEMLNRYDIKISMNGKGRSLDNVWIERFWKSLKYDYIYLNPCDDGNELFEGVLSHIEYYNAKTHQTTKQSPNHLYNQKLNHKAA